MFLVEIHCMAIATYSVFIIKLLFRWKNYYFSFTSLTDTTPIRLARHLQNENASTCTILGLKLSVRHSSHVLPLNFSLLGGRKVSRQQI